MSKNKILVPGAENNLNKFKMEVAKDLAVEYNNIKNETSNPIEKISSSGNIGGEMVKRMIAEQERQLINKN